MKRTFEVDLRVCVGCGGRLTVRALFTDPATVGKMLAALRRPRALRLPPPEPRPQTARPVAP